jgi:hypothetical protein
MRRIRNIQNTAGKERGIRNTAGKEKGIRNTVGKERGEFVKQQTTKERIYNAACKIRWQICRHGRQRKGRIYNAACNIRLQICRHGRQRKGRIYNITQDAKLGGRFVDTAGKERGGSTI